MQSTVEYSKNKFMIKTAKLLGISGLIILCVPFISDIIRVKKFFPINEFITSIIGWILLLSMIFYLWFFFIMFFYLDKSYKKLPKEPNQSDIEKLSKKEKIIWKTSLGIVAFYIIVSLYFLGGGEFFKDMIKFLFMIFGIGLIMITSVLILPLIIEIHNTKVHELPKIIKAGEINPDEIPKMFFGVLLMSSFVFFLIFILDSWAVAFGYFRDDKAIQTGIFIGRLTILIGSVYLIVQYFLIKKIREKERKGTKNIIFGLISMLGYFFIFFPMIFVFMTPLYGAPDMFYLFVGLMVILSFIYAISCFLSVLSSPLVPHIKLNKKQIIKIISIVIGFVLYISILSAISYQNDIEKPVGGRATPRAEINLTISNDTYIITILSFTHKINYSDLHHFECYIYNGSDEKYLVMSPLQNNITITKNNETSLLYLDKDKNGKLSDGDKFFIKSKLIGKYKLKFVIKYLLTNRISCEKQLS